MKTLPASEFKARCLAVLDEVERTGEPVLILKRGRPVAQLVAPTAAAAELPQRTLKGTVKVRGDIVGPAVSPETWDAERESK